MLIRISLIVAIIAGLAVGALNFVKVKETIIGLRTDLASETKQKEEAKTQLASTRRDLDKTTKDRDQLKATLATTTTERDEAVAKAEAQNKRANDLAENLAKTQKDRDDAQAGLAAYKATGQTAEQVLALAKDLKELQDSLAEAKVVNTGLMAKVSNLQFELDKFRGVIHIVYLPQNLQGKIVVADPKWDFVVLNIGLDQGVKTDGELLVSRGGKLVAKVIVRSVQKDRSIANVMPGWKLGEVLEGDQVLPAHPES
jgi:hypothetical protein